MFTRTAACLLAGLGLTASRLAAGDPALSGEPLVELRWPTENRALAEGRPGDFYQPTISKRAVSGMFGFVRSNLPEPPPYLERFHEGIDIRPVRRDPSGRPLDPVFAAAAGRVVYANTVASRSNFGLYVILAHDYGPYTAYTTYGHLARLTARVGDEVAAGAEIGILGATGNVDSLSRAHLHFEFGFLFNDDFPTWFDRHAEPSEGENHHGMFNGNNLFGVDPARILMETEDGRPPTLRAVLARERCLFRVRLPAAPEGRTYFWQKQFPFMTEPAESGLPIRSWEVDCNPIGIPLKFRPSPVATDRAEVIWFDESLPLQQTFTRGLVEKREGKRTLSARTGRKWATLLMWNPEPASPNTAPSP